MKGQVVFIDIDLKKYEDINEQRFNCYKINIIDFIRELYLTIPFIKVEIQDIYIKYINSKIDIKYIKDIKEI